MKPVFFFEKIFIYTQPKGNKKIVCKNILLWMLSNDNTYLSSMGISGSQKCWKKRGEQRVISIIT